MNISIIGSGYVGLVTGACLASEGMDVLCCDNDNKKIENLKKGICPIYEPCLDSLLDSCAVKEKKLHFTTDIKHAVNFSDVIFITVNTPVLDNNMCDTSRVLKQPGTGKHMTGYKIVVTKHRTGRHREENQERNRKNVERKGKRPGLTHQFRRSVKPGISQGRVRC